MITVIPRQLTALLLTGIMAIGVSGAGGTVSASPQIGRAISSAPQTGGSAASASVQVGDIEVAYRVLGAGDPLVLIMGFGGTMDLWDPTFLRALAADYQVIIFDNRGMGLTSAPPGDFSIEQFADDTIGLMTALGIDRAHILGWSMGSYVAQELVLRYPERVDRLVLYAGDCGGEEAIPPSDDVLRQLHDTSGTAEERGGRLIRLILPERSIVENGDYLGFVFNRPMEPVEPESVMRQADAIDRWQGTCQQLGKIQPQTLVITGTEDILTPPANSLVLVNGIPGAWLVQLAGGGHGAMFQYPIRLARIIHEFLKA